MAFFCCERFYSLSLYDGFDELWHVSEQFETKAQANLKHWYNKREKKTITACVYPYFVSIGVVKFRYFAF
jgi:hypothetical protein